jgi:hypothetical protein
MAAIRGEAAARQFAVIFSLSAIAAVGDLVEIGPQ